MDFQAKVADNLCCRRNPLVKKTFIGTVLIGSLVGVICGIYAAAAGHVYLKDNEYVVLTGVTDKYTEEGPGTVFFDPFWYDAEVMDSVQLLETQYLRVTNQLNGSRRVVKGPVLFFPGPWDEKSDVIESVQLYSNQYAKVIDSASGRVRVVSGEQRLFLGPWESLDTEVLTAVNVDEDTAALVVSELTGQQRLITEHGLFFPGPYDEVIESRGLTFVEPHEVVITRNVEGVYSFYGSNDTQSGVGTSFFLQPYHELVTMTWSSDSGVDSTVEVSKIDTRARYSSFEYIVRTSDNVELVLEGIVFWQVIDVPTMIEATADPQGDVWYHSRSALNAAVSASTLEEFMAGFNDLVTSANLDQAFYQARGIQLHTLEVTRYSCHDPDQEQVLQEIIAETTNRINSLQRQKSVNDVEAEALAAEVLLEEARLQLVQAEAANERAKLIAEQAVEIELLQNNVSAEINLTISRTQLVNTQATNDLLQAKATGEAEGLRYAHSLDSFEEVLKMGTIENPNARLEMYRFLSEQEATNEQLASTTSNLGSGSAQLYLTPDSLNLNLQQVSVSSTGGFSPALLATTLPNASAPSAPTAADASSGVADEASGEGR